MVKLLCLIKLYFPNNGTGVLIFFFLCSCLFNPILSFCQEKLYNDNYSVACHNCFEKKYSNGISDVLSYTSTLELDIWDMPLLLKKSGAMQSDWYVKHTFLEKGNRNSFGGSLANCLASIENWSECNPNHDVLTVFIDKKQGWSNKNGTRRPQDLDFLLLSIFGKDKIYTPKDFAGTNIDLRTALKQNSWASLNSLKGKVLFIITDATFFRPRNIVLERYIQKVKENAVCFVAPTIKKPDEISSPKGISENNVANIVFYNLNYKNASLCGRINSHNFVNRVFRSPETVNEIKSLTEKKVNFVALYNYKLQGRLN